MATVIHTRKGKYKYMYEHTREGDKVKTRYMHPVDEEGNKRVAQHRISNIDKGIREIKDLDYEKGLIYDSNTNKLISVKEGKKEEIRFSEKDVKNMRDNIFVHNHPEDSSFSVADYWIAGNYRLKEIKAVTDTKVYSLKITSIEGTKSCMDIHRNLGKKFTKIEREMIKKYPNDSWESITHRVNQTISKTIEGLEYTAKTIR